MCQYVYTHFKLPFFLCLIRVAAEETVEAIKYAYSSQQTTTSTDADDSQQITTSTDVDDSHTLANVNDTAPPPNDGLSSTDEQFGGDYDPFPTRYNYSTAPGKFKKRRSHTPLDESDSDAPEEDEGLPTFGSSEDEAEEEEGENRKIGSDDEDDLDPSSLSSASLKIVKRKGGSDDYGRVKLAGGKWISNYEYQRLQKMADNKKLMDGFDFPDAVQAVIGPARTPPPPGQQRVRVHPAPKARVLPGRASKSLTKS